MSGKHLYQLATFLTSEGNSALLPANAHDWTMTKGGMFMMRLMLTLGAWHIFQTVFSTIRKYI